MEDTRTETCCYRFISDTSQHPEYETVSCPTPEALSRPSYLGFRVPGHRPGLSGEGVRAEKVLCVLNSPSGPLFAQVVACLWLGGHVRGCQEASPKRTQLCGTEMGTGADTSPEQSTPSDPALQTITSKEIRSEATQNTFTRLC